MEFMEHLQDGVDDLKPSLFELLSEQQLTGLLPPSIRYILAVATHRYPRYLLRILNSYDEVYALVSLVVERHYLRNYSSSFTEHFYGLKRERVLRVKSGEIPRAQIGAPSLVRESLKLRPSDVWKNLALIVGVPYLKRKLDEAHEVYAPAAGAVLLGPQYQQDQLPSDATLRQKVVWFYKWFLRRVYPHLNAAYYASFLAFQLAYLFDSSRYSSPFLWLISTRMRRLTEADYRAFDAASKASSEPKPTRPGQTMSIFNPRTLTRALGPRLFKSLRVLLPTSIFALKFLEWWHASDFSRQLSRKAAEGLELPPPILSGPLPWSLKALKAEQARVKQDESDEKPVNGVLKHPKIKPPVSSTSYLPIFTVPPTEGEDSNLCPICLSPVVTATASPYGYVFCYVCIHKWVEGEHDRQHEFMAGQITEDVANVWDDDEKAVGQGKRSREGRWENGKGRCPVTAKRILGGTETLRRVVV